jgi:hypothetical protein
MKRVLIFATVLLLPLPLYAMRSLSDSDLSNISNPLSLSINPNQAMNINDSKKTWSDSEGISKFLLYTINLKRNYDIYQNEVSGDTTETQATTRQLYFFYASGFNNDSHISIQNFLIDQITLKDKTTIVSAEDITSPNNIKVTHAESTHSLDYPNGLTKSSNSAYTYMIKSGDIDMRNTYINQTKSIINSGSWVDIKTR